MILLKNFNLVKVPSSSNMPLREVKNRCGVSTIKTEWDLLQDRNDLLLDVYGDIRR